jgi:hypothetical protein
MDRDRDRRTPRHDVDWRSFSTIALTMRVPEGRFSRRPRAAAPLVCAQAMTRDTARACVKRWAETGRLLERQRWDELAALGPREALEATDALIRAALLVPLSDERRRYSGLVEQQRAFHGKRS